MTQVDQFHFLAHTFISLIGAVLLLVLWRNIRVRFRKILEDDEAQKGIDKGLLYLSLSLFTWVASGLWAYIGYLQQHIDSLGYDIGVRLLSTLNNYLLLRSILYLRYAPKILQGIRPYLKHITLGIIGIAVLCCALSVAYQGEAFLGMKPSSLPDLLLSTILSYLMIVSFYQTFDKRGLPLVGTIAVIAIGLMLLSQLPEVFAVLNDNFINNLVRIVAKTSLIAIFLVLATTWAIQLAHTPRPKEMHLHFMDWGQVKISIPSKDIVNEIIDFKSKATQYKNLLWFAVKRKHHDASSQYLEIGAGGEIKSQTYLTRIIDNINDVLTNPAEDKLDRRDLFTFLGQGRYRLRVLPENIIIDEALLAEFEKTVEKEG